MKSYMAGNYRFWQISDFYVLVLVVSEMSECVCVFMR